MDIWIVAYIRYFNLIVIYITDVIILVSGVYMLHAILNEGRSFPGGALVKNPPANAGDTGSSCGLGGSHMPQSN